MKVLSMYRWHVGTVAWVLHRLSGLALAGYLMLHVVVIHNISRGPKAFNDMMGMVQSPLFRFLEIGLLGTVLYHAFNGVRILLVDLGWGAKRHKALFCATMTIAAALFAAGGIRMMMHALHSVAH